MDNSKLPAYPMFSQYANPSEIDTFEDFSKYTIGLNKVEIFTMAAMQGLCANSKLWQSAEGLDADIDEWISIRSTQIAHATLSKLSKHQ